MRVRKLPIRVPPPHPPRQPPFWERSNPRAGTAACSASPPRPPRPPRPPPSPSPPRLCSVAALRRRPRCCRPGIGGAGLSHYRAGRAGGESRGRNEPRAQTRALATGRGFQPANIPESGGRTRRARDGDSAAVGERSRGPRRPRCAGPPEWVFDQPHCVAAAPPAASLDSGRDGRADALAPGPRACSVRPQADAGACATARGRARVW